MAAGCQTSFGTGGIHGRVDNFRVTQRGNGFLCGQHFIADFTVAAGCQTSFGTGGIHGRVNDLGMTQSGNFFLGGQNFVTDRAMGALGQAGRGAVRLHGGINDLGMTQSGLDGLATGGADHTFGAGGLHILCGSANQNVLFALGAGNDPEIARVVISAHGYVLGILDGDNISRGQIKGNGFSVSFAGDGDLVDSVQLDDQLVIGGFAGNLVFQNQGAGIKSPDLENGAGGIGLVGGGIPAVCIEGEGIGGAVLQGTGIHIFLARGHHIVTLRGNYGIGVAVAAVGAGVGSVAVDGTGGGGGNRAVAVTGGGQDRLGHKGGAAEVAVAALCQTGCLTGGLHPGRGDGYMAVVSVGHAADLALGPEHTGSIATGMGLPGGGYDGITHGAGKCRGAVVIVVILIGQEGGRHRGGLIGIYGNICPLMFAAVVGNDGRGLRTADCGEDISADGLQGGGEMDLFQIVAALKGPGMDGSNTFGDGDFRQTIHVGKGRSADLGNAGLQNHFRDIHAGLALVPGLLGAEIKVLHFSAAVDGQLALRCQLPVEGVFGGGAAVAAFQIDALAVIVEQDIAFIQQIQTGHQPLEAVTDGISRGNVLQLHFQRDDCLQRTSQLQRLGEFQNHLADVGLCVQLQNTPGDKLCGGAVLGPGGVGAAVADAAFGAGDGGVGDVAVTAVCCGAVDIAGVENTGGAGDGAAVDIKVTEVVNARVVAAGAGDGGAGIDVSASVGGGAAGGFAVVDGMSELAGNGGISQVQPAHIVDGGGAGEGAVIQSKEAAALNICGAAVVQGVAPGGEIAAINSQGTALVVGKGIALVVLGGKNSGVVDGGLAVTGGGGRPVIIAVGNLNAEGAAVNGQLAAPVINIHTPFVGSEAAAEDGQVAVGNNHAAVAVAVVSGTGNGTAACAVADGQAGTLGNVHGVTVGDGQGMAVQAQVGITVDRQAAGKGLIGGKVVGLAVKAAAGELGEGNDFVGFLVVTALLADSMLGMGAGGGGNFLGHDDVATGITMAALSQTGKPLGGGHSGVNDLGVAGGRDSGLGNEGLAAAGAVLALSLAGGCAGGSHSGTDDLHMAEGFSLGQGAEGAVPGCRTAYIHPVMLPGGTGQVAAGADGIILTIFAGPLMTQLCNGFGFGCGAAFPVAGSLALTGGGAGGLCHGFPFAPVMSQGSSAGPVGGSMATDGAGNFLAAGPGRRQCKFG